MVQEAHRRFAISRVGWRVFGLFLLAAALPIALIAALTERSVSAAWREGQAVVASNTAKAAALQALDRLQVAAHALSTVASAARVPTLPAGRAAEPLAAVVEVAADGTRRVVQGGTRAAPLLRMPLPEAGPTAVGPIRIVTTQPTGASAPDVVLVHDEASAQRRLLGLVDPAFLWEDAAELPTGMWMCALTAARAPLFCSDGRQAGQADVLARAARPGRDELPPHAVKDLFLAAQFAAPSWTFVTGSGANAGGALASVASSVVPTVALASLMLVTLLSLVQIRRTLRPLARLADGARQIAQRRFGARVDVHSRDEFGELANAFNEMAEQIEGQFAELGILAAVDRQMVEQAGIDAAFATIARRVAVLLPGRCVAVARLTAPDGNEVAMQRSGSVEGPCTVVLEPALAAALWGADVAEGDAAAALTRAFGWPGHEALRVLPLRWRERRLGFIAIGSGPNDAIDADAMRQLDELRDRAAVAANAAEREERLVQEAHHDALTGLLNRSGLQDRLADVLERPDASSVAVLVLDLDRFKHVNDTLGHAAGDQALRIVAARLRRCVGERGTVARRAGDEFVVVLDGPASAGEASRLAQAICTSMASAVTLESQPFVLGGSVGIALANPAQLTARELLRRADEAMYQAKQRGGGRYAFFDPQQDEQALRRAWIERDLPGAAQRGELLLHYQPRVNARTQTVESVEALVRWNHPLHGLVSPNEFIPVAEQSELIEHLGAWVIEAACAQSAQWRRDGLTGLRVAVNLSARQLDSARLEPDLLAAMARHGVAAQDLELEITESVFVDHAAATIQRLEALRRMGMTVALDDFGTGYSSMSYLRRLPLDVLKIDRAFVQDLGVDRSALAVAQAIVTLARSLDMRTVAEGVETAAQEEALVALGCDELQGFRFSRPVPAGDLALWLATREQIPEPA